MITKADNEVERSVARVLSAGQRHIAGQRHEEKLKTQELTNADKDTEIFIRQ